METVKEARVLRLRPNTYAAPIFHPDYNAYETDLWGGRGRGGSYHLTLKAVQSIYELPYFRGYFVRAVHAHIRNSLWKDFLDRLDELSELNGRDLRKEFLIRENSMSAVCLHNGNEIMSKGFRSSTKDNTAHMKSIAGATDVFIEECEEVGENEYNKLADSLRTIKGEGVKIWRSYNAPPKDHWLMTQYYEMQETRVDGFFKAVSRNLPGHRSIFGTFRDNLKNLDPNTIARYLRYKETNPKYYWNQIKGLVSDGGDARVYYGWKRISYRDFLQIDAPMVYGLDFGDTAPTCLVAVKYSDGCFYRHEIFYKSMRAMQVQYQEALSKIRDPEFRDNSIWGKHKGLLTYVFNLIGVDRDTPIFCDPAQKGLIMELRENGWSAVEAKKDKMSNINFINRALNYYTDESENLETEYAAYYLETDINGHIIDGKPIKMNDHSMDAQEYACRGLKDLYEIVL